MNNELPLKQIIDAALSRIGSVADVNTVVGEPLAVGDGVTIIPFSKVSVGFASGGVDFDGKNKRRGTTRTSPAGTARAFRSCRSGFWSSTGPRCACWTSSTPKPARRVRRTR